MFLLAEVWRVILGVLVAALMFSTYMVVYTSRLNSSEFNLTVIFPNSGLSPRDNADLLLHIIGDKTSYFNGVINDDDCRVFVYWTEKQGSIAVIYCRDENIADAMVYVNDEGLPLGRAGINGMDAAQEVILSLAYGVKKAKTAFVIDYSRSERVENLTLVKVRQSINGLLILGSGFEITVDETRKRIHRLTAYHIYGLEELVEAPEPRYEALSNTLRHININPLDTMFNVRGLAVCGGDTAFFITIDRVALALVEANTGEVLGLYVFDEEGGLEVITPRGCRVDWLGLPENWYKPISA